MKGRLLLKILRTYLLICLLAGIVLAEISVRLHKLALGDTKTFGARMVRLQAKVENASITASDGAVLKAWFIVPANANGQSVIILHGITANRMGSTGFAEMFLSKGYSVLVPDSRDHGESGGRIATYGVLERYDVRQWVEWMRQREPGCTYLLGESMGAAIGLQAAAVTPGLCAVAVEDPYAGFREIGYERLGRGSHTGSLFWKTVGRPILEVAMVYTRVRYGIYLPDADDLVAVERAKAPTLLISGTEDISIPMHHGAGAGAGVRFALRALDRYRRRPWRCIFGGARGVRAAGARVLRSPYLTRPRG